MPEFGQFQILEPLKLTDHGSVNVATRIGDGQRRYALKVFPVPAEVLRHGGADGDEDEEVSPHWEAQYFLDHARVQQKLNASGASHWAAVHDLGMTPAGAYVVLDFCPRSVQTLLDQKARLAAPELRGLAAGALAGLTELKRLRGRSHGDLKPANVLLDGGEEVSTARILLTDPGAPAAAAKTGEDGDLRALGEMLRALVIGDAAGASSSDAWDRLGTARDPWRQYIGGLLGAGRGTPLGTLAAAQAALPRLGSSSAGLLQPLVAQASRLWLPLVPARRGQTPVLPPAATTNKNIPSRQIPLPAKRIILAAAAAIVIIGAIVATLLALQASQWKQYQQARSQWIGGLLSATAGKSLPAWASDPQLRDVLDRIAQANLRDPADARASAIPHSPAEYFHRRAAIAAEAAIAADLSPDHWQRLQHLTDLQKRFAERGWKQPADFLAALAAAATPPAANLADGIDRILQLSPAIDQTLPSIDAAWQQLTAVTDVLTAPRNPMLDAFAAHLLASAGTAVQLSDVGLAASGDALASRLQLAKQLDKATRETSVDGPRFAEAMSNRIDVNHVTDADVKTYLDTVAQYAIQRHAIASATDTLHRALSDMAKTISNSRPKESESSALATDRAAVEAQIKAFADFPFIARDISDGSFGRRQQAIAAQIDALGKYSHPETPGEWVASLTPPPVASPALLAAWQNKLQSLRAAIPTLDRNPPALLATKTATARFRQSLSDLGRAFDRPPTALTPAFAVAATDRREQLLKQSLSAIDAPSGRLDFSVVQSASGEYDAWLQQLAALNADFPLRQPILTLADRPDLTWAKQADFWADPVIHSLVAPDLSRIHQLAAVGSADRPALVADLTSPTPEIALAAWRRLGDAAGQAGSAWPTQAGELQTEADAEHHLQSLLSPMHDPIAESALRDLPGQSATRWQRFAESARSDPAIQNALALAPAFGIARGQFDQLPWPMNFNFWLAATRNSARAGDEAGLNADLPHLQALANTQKSVPASFATLGQPDPREPFFGQQLGETYSLPLAGLAKPLDFRRVEAGGIRPFYLAERDISFADFAGVVEGAKAWADVRALPWSARPGQTDNRRGPRVWQWTGPADSAKMTPPDLWFTPDDANDFAPRFRASEFNRNALADAFGGNPTPAHPMQQISAEAALWYAGLCGVRLPSSAEWQSAYAAFAKDIPPEKWNLRDQTWDEQRQYLASVSAASGGGGGGAAAGGGGGAAAGGTGPAAGGSGGAGGGSHWLDQEIFLPTGLHIPTGATARARPASDGTLLFRPVDARPSPVSPAPSVIPAPAAPPAPASPAFHDLVGNVFIYLCDAPDAFASLTDKSPASIHQFAAAHASALSVIGGSALSPPKPQSTNPNR